MSSQIIVMQKSHVGLQTHATIESVSLSLVTKSPPVHRNLGCRGH